MNLIFQSIKFNAFSAQWWVFFTGEMTYCCCILCCSCCCCCYWCCCCCVCCGNNVVFCCLSLVISDSILHMSFWFLGDISVKSEHSTLLVTDISYLLINFTMLPHISIVINNSYYLQLCLLLFVLHQVKSLYLV